LLVAQPIKLPANQFDHFYKGGNRIGKLRNGPGGPMRPEEWLGSTTTRFGSANQGLTLLEDGTTLKESVSTNPESWLGKAHVNRFGASIEILVKLLDPDQRLPVHYHPKRNFAKQHLGVPHGKTEAWIVLEAPKDAWVGIGFESNMTMSNVKNMVEKEDTTGLINSLNKRTVKAGEGILVPAGIPHAIAEGIFILELQEPTDFSILLEWEGFAVDGLKDGHLNLGFDLALQALNLDALKSEDVEKLVVSTENDSSLMTSMLPVQAEPYFRSHLLRPKNASLEFAPGFSILLATQGNGQINTEKQGNFAIDKGDAFIIPFESGSWSLTGNIEVLLSRPPAPDAPMSSL
jgi:mannose-6-phosphate isomerase